MSQQAPVIGVTLCLDPGKRWRLGRDYVYLQRAYLQRLRVAGAAPIALSPDLAIADCVRVCDGIVLSGGGDLPASFATRDLDVPGLPGEAEDPERIAWERELLDACEHSRCPVLGICYGMQLACIHFGGRLHLDLAARSDQSLAHGSSAHPTRHQVTKVGASEILAGLASQFVSNSAHQQGVAELPLGLAAIARSSDSLIEAFETQGDAWLTGLQWHPESDETAEQVYPNFVRRVRCRL